MFGHLDIRSAIGASLVSVIACSCGGAAQFLRGGLTNIRLAIVLETATTLGALTGVLLAGVIPANVLFLVFALVLVLSAVQMMLRRGEPTAMAPASPRGAWVRQLDATYPDLGSGQAVAYPVRALPAGLSLMYGAGLLSALLGIGSGVLKIPAMDTALRLPLKVSSATSNFMIGVTAAASAGAYFARGEISAPVAGPVAVGSVLGAIIGARLLLKLSPDKLRLLFAGVLVLLAGQMLVGAFGAGSVGGAG